VRPSLIAIAGAAAAIGRATHDLQVSSDTRRQERTIRSAEQRSDGAPAEVAEGPREAAAEDEAERPKEEAEQAREEAE
jgi:hypothetical protein